ncbi:hypothetical protein QUF76_12430 [Desulfobacterales bacterium HSG16]|nr:hypothetical protein [Desulfobacterales bacterium HSG16]
MAFSDYKNISQVQKQYTIKYKEENFIVVQDVEPSRNFVEEFEFNREKMDVYSSEASRSEVIIFPVLREVWKKYSDKYSLWIQKHISYDKNLSGTPDYIISTRSELGKTVLDAPLVIVVEAKKNDFEQGWAQSLAEMVAAQKINDNANLPVYGIVTDGKLWEFGKLYQNFFTKNIMNYTIDNLAGLFGVLNMIFESVDSELDRWAG